ncbi:MAG: hypothetical protein ABIH76_04895 [Candidatus Bathyarchaeota archaeon]
MTNLIAYCKLEDGDELEEVNVKDIAVPEEQVRDNSHDHSQYILSLLSKEPNAEVTFQGLKRRTGLHQEILSRTLKRLERDELLLKTSSGAYKMNAEEENLHIDHNIRRHEDIVVVTQLGLPKYLKPEILASKLTYTWFGTWRWYGYSENGPEKTLIWISEEGDICVNVRIADSTMHIEAGPIESTGRDRCIRAGFELLRHVIRSSFVEPKEMQRAN